MAAAYSAYEPAKLRELAREALQTAPCLACPPRSGRRGWCVVGRRRFAGWYLGVRGPAGAEAFVVGRGYCPAGHEVTGSCVL
jgi:hypothetical protein